MTRLHSLLLALLLAGTSVSQAEAQLTSTQAFTTAPRKVLPLLDENARLDMIDYFNSNLTNSTKNSYGGKSNITALSPEQITIKLTDASQCQISVLPDGKDGLIAMITTVASPTPDSRMSIYTADWSRELTSATFKKPTLTDWLTPEGKKNSQEVEMTVPFLLISYSYNPADKTLTLTNNTKQYLGADIYSSVSSYLLPEIKYNFDGKRFNRM